MIFFGNVLLCTFAGALESVTEEADPADPPLRARGGRRGARGGRMGRAGGARGRGAAPMYRYRKLLICLIHLYQIRICDGCGARLRSTYIRTHQLRYCHGPPVDEPEAGSEIDSEEEERIALEEEEELDEVLGEVNDEDQTLLGAGLGGANVEEEEQALRLQQQLARQRQQRERTPPGAEREEEEEEGWSDLSGRFRALHRPARRQRMASPLSTSSSDSSHATSSPSDTSLVVDDDGRPVIPAPVEPLPLNLTGVLMILIKI